jgi:hypothetical protein
MDLARAQSLAASLVVRFESLDAQHPNLYSPSLAFARRMVELLSPSEGLSRLALQVLLAEGRGIADPDCAVQEGLYALSGLLRAQGVVPRGA